MNTGLREQEVVNLRWMWEVPVPELGTSVFVVARAFVKNGLDRYVVLNRIAKSVIDGCRGEHPEFVFTRRGKPITRIYNSGWKAARRRASKRYASEFGRSCPKGFQSIRVHDLKHYLPSLTMSGGICDAVAFLYRCRSGRGSQSSRRTITRNRHGGSAQTVARLARRHSRPLASRNY